MLKILLTGSAGFIGSNLIKIGLEQNLYNWVGVDKLVEPNNIYNLDEKKYHTYIGDFADAHWMERVMQIEKPDIIIHCGAESFVCSSIENCLPFLHSNILGTQVVVDLAVKYRVKRFVYISTDEVYGQLRSGEKPWTEASPPNPRNPYSASKLSGEYIVRLANRQYGLPYIISRCSNNYGQRQPLRNLVPVAIYCNLVGKKVPLHNQGMPEREWIYCHDHNFAILRLLTAPLNQIYNIGSGVEMTNMEMIARIAVMMDKPLQFEFIGDRKGQDQKYLINCDKIKRLDWTPDFTFEQGMRRTIDWYLTHPEYFELGRK
jgi:dTDP-glucose 4,6-dehydratase